MGGCVAGSCERWNARVPELDELSVGERDVLEIDVRAGRQVRGRAGRLDERGQAGDVVRLDMGLEDGDDPRTCLLGLRQVRVDELLVRVDHCDLPVRETAQQVRRARRLPVEERTEDHPVEISSSTGIARLRASQTGEWPSAHLTSSRSSSSSASSAATWTRIRAICGPGRTPPPASSRPRISVSLSAVTSSRVSETPSSAARIAIAVAVHEVQAARTSHAGVGPEPLPPTGVGMSVTSAQPSPPSTRQRRPSSTTAVAGLSVEGPASVFDARAFLTLMIASPI